MIAFSMQTHQLSAQELSRQTSRVSDDTLVDAVVLVQDLNIGEVS
jgi:hypothetical protein